MPFSRRCCSSPPAPSPCGCTTSRIFSAWAGWPRSLPLAFWSFLIGSASLAAFPLITAGFYSKDAILSAAWAPGGGGPAALARRHRHRLRHRPVYFPRRVHRVFRRRQNGESPAVMAGASPAAHRALGAGAGRRACGDAPALWAEQNYFPALLAPVFRHCPAARRRSRCILFASVISLAGLGLAYALYWRIGPRFAPGPARPAIAACRNFFCRRLGFRCAVYAPGRAAVPGAGPASTAHDVIDRFYTGIAWTCRWLHRRLGATADRADPLVCELARRRLGRHHRRRGAAMMLLWLILIPVLGGMLAWAGARAPPGCAALGLPRRADPGSARAGAGRPGTLGRLARPA